MSPAVPRISRSLGIGIMFKSLKKYLSGIYSTIREL
jgi:hypothetical protein